MTLGLSGKFSILSRSPLDRFPAPEPASIEPGPEAATWVASRFNVHASDEDDRLILWNSYTGAISVFPADHRDKVKALLTRGEGVVAPAEGLVEYLHQRGFLVKKETDELLRFQLRFGRRHYRTDHMELMLLSSEDCNFRCQYCYERFARGTMLPWVRSAIKELVQKRLDSGLRSLGISWFGGEPLYGFEAIADLAPFFRRVTTERKIDFYAGITTNGYLLTPDVADKLLEWGTKNIQVTLDGAPVDHDRLRHTRTGKGSFAQIFDNLIGMRDRKDSFVLHIRINFDPESHGRLKEFIGLVGQEFGNDPRFRLLLRPVGRWGGSKDQELEVCSMEERESIVGQLTEEIGECGLGNFDDLRLTGRFGALACYAAQPNHFIIGADGKVMKCTMALDTYEGNVVGRITENGELKVDEHKLALWTEPVFSSRSQCKRCVVLPVCQSLACPYDRIKGAEVSCPPLRKTVKKRLVWTQRASRKVNRRVKVQCDSGTDSLGSST